MMTGSAVEHDGIELEAYVSLLMLIKRVDQSKAVTLMSACKKAILGMVAAFLKAPFSPVIFKVPNI